MSSNSISSTSNGSERPNVGAIAGGVVSGVAIVCIMTFLVGKFCLKGHRVEYSEGDWEYVNMDDDGDKYALTHAAHYKPPVSLFSSISPEIENNDSFHTAPTSFGTSRGVGTFFTAPSYLTSDSHGNYRYVKRDWFTVDTRHQSILRSSGLSALDPNSEVNWSGRGMHVEFGEHEQTPLRDAVFIAKTSRAQLHAVTCGRIRICRKTQRVHKRFTASEALEEVRHLQALKHSHITVLFESYYQDRNLSILTYPVADLDLKNFLEDVPKTAEKFNYRAETLRSAMQKFFSCLSSAVAFVHLTQIKHMDIKPANILISADTSRFPSPPTFHLFLTDFGISRKIRDPNDSQTDGWTGRTEMYCSPEVAEHEPRGRTSDIFSLGCVFAEILTCMCGHTMQEFLDYRTDEGESLHCNINLVAEWINRFSIEEAHGFSVWKATVMKMLSRGPDMRPNASDLMKIFPEWSCCKKGPCVLEAALPRLPRERGLICSTSPSDICCHNVVNRHLSTPQTVI